MVVRPLAAYRLKPIRRTKVRKCFDQDMITALLEGEQVSISTLRRPLKVLKDAATRQTSE